MTASHREQVLDAWTARLVTAMSGADVARNRAKASTPGPGGQVIVRDGDPGNPDEFLSPHSYTWNHRVVLDVAAYESATQTREQVLDGMFADISAVIEADRTLGGLCEWIEPEAPVTNDAQAPGTEPIRWAELGIVFVYTTTSPLL